MLGSLQLLQPTTIDEACGALHELGDRAKIYAGGAELLLLMRHRLVTTEVLVNIKNIAGINRLAWDGTFLRAGACATHHALESSPVVWERAPLFADAESQVANVRVRNQGTLGGNLCFNDPHSDPGTVLLVFEASVRLASRRGERRLKLDDFLLDIYTTALEPDELLLEVQIPPLPARMHGSYLRLHRYQRPTLGVAAALKMNSGNIEQSRLAIGCVGPRPQRLVEIESKVKGTTLTDAEKIIAGQKTYLRELLRPVDDLLGSVDYKLYMSCVLLKEALHQAAQKSDLPLTDSPALRI
ncbi:MAG TPA: xanthine dehydrogenase family protein subunit M [Candidatus Binatia bacterium]|nr:xanthine dehydrogenase family protein subunit M [Candidatus Binatia bacterium]